MRVYSATDVGQKRKMNQDYVFVSETPVGNLQNLFVVADGMGGHNAGDYASSHAVQTLVEEMVRLGEIKREEARNHPDKNIITRALGAERTVDIDFFDLKLEPDSTILMCSDGLSNMVEDSKLEEIILDQTEELPKKGEKLLKEANQNGGKDNIAVILVEPFTNEVEKC